MDELKGLDQMGEAKIWRVKFCWAVRCGDAWEPRSDEMLVEEMDFDGAVAIARKHWRNIGLAETRVIQSVENLGPLVIRL